MCLIIVGALRRLIWVFEFWNEMLVSNIRCKNLSKKASSLESVTRILWKERGEKLMTCHLFLDNFLRFYNLWVVFKGLGVLKQKLVSRKLKYLNFDIMKCSSFLNLVFCERRFIAENWLCFRACNSRIVTYDQEFLFCGVILCFNHCYGIFFEKFSF